MLKKIVHSYGALLSSAGKIVALLFLCIVFGCAFVLPLWKFAVSSPRAYTIAVLACIFLFFATFVVKKAISIGFFRFFILIAKIALVFLAMALSIWLVLLGKRLFALFVIALAVIFYGAISEFAKRKSDKI